MCTHIIYLNRTNSQNYMSATFNNIQITSHGNDLLATWQFFLTPNNLTSLKSGRKTSLLAQGYLMNGHTDWNSWRHSLGFMAERKIP